MNSLTEKLTKAFPQIFLICISFFFAACSCYPALTKVEDANSKIPSVFDVGNQSYLYQSAVDYGEYHFGGLFLFKIEDQSARAILSSETGIKFLDVEVLNGKCTVHYVMEQMNNPFILKPIKKDLQVILRNTFLMPQKQMRNGNFASAFKKGNMYYFIDETNRLRKIEQCSGAKVQTEFLFNYDVNALPNMEINHIKQNLSVKLNYIER